MIEGHGDKATRLWLKVLAATLVLQSVSAFLTRVAPTIAPYLMNEVGLPSSAIGHLSAIGTLGSMAFLLIGAPVIRRIGSIRILQIGTAVAALGALMFLVPHTIAAVLAVLLIGLGYGPSPAAGSEVLQRYSPPDRRSLIFSIKQAGVPVGGVLAGLVLPPAVLAFGVVGAVACCLIISLAALVLVQPLRVEVDAERDRSQRIDIASLFAAGNLLAPVRAVIASREIALVALAGACFAVGQGIWFAYLVTFMVLQLDYSLAFAGIVFAVMQATGIFGRIALGWLADRIGSGAMVLAIAGIASALCSVGLAMAVKSWPAAMMIALAGIAGVAVSSWNGVQVAEVVRLSTKAQIHTTVAGATMVIFTGYVIGPILFAILISATGRYDLGFLTVAAVCLIGAIFALGARRAA
ncbi:MAG: MFS transporter [Hyphomicrobiaceae bacterium]